MHERRRRTHRESSPEVRSGEARPPALEWASAAGSAAVARLARERRSTPAGALSHAPGVIARAVMIDELAPTSEPPGPEQEEQSSSRQPEGARWAGVIDELDPFAEAPTAVDSEPEQERPAGGGAEMLPPGGHVPIEQDPRY